MSTRSVIARTVPENGESYFEGRYHHWDGYPTALGKTLWDIYRDNFQRRLDRMLRFLIHEHPAGWSTINGADFALAAGYQEVKYRQDRRRRSGVDWTKPLPHGPICYCHGSRVQPPWLIVNDGKKDIIAGSGLEWAYVFDPEHRRMYVLQARMPDGNRAIGMFGCGPAGSFWFEAAVLSLEGPEPDWNEVQKAERTITTPQENDPCQTETSTHPKA